MTMFARFNIFLAVIFAFSAHAYRIKDDLSHTISLAKPAQRIISLAPDITEILFAIGAGQKVIGVVSGCDFPKEAQKIPEVGSYSGIDLEKIISLHPDLIVTWSNTFGRQLQVLKNLGIPIYTTQPRNLEDIPRTMKNLGQLTGTEQTANEIAKKFLQRIVMIQKRYQAEKSVTVFYQIGSYSLMTINKESWINQVISLCGGQNVFANTHSIAPEVSWEAVIVANPEVILSGAHNSDWQKSFQKWPEIQAVKKGLLFPVNPDWMGRAGPRLLNAIDSVCQDLDEARTKL